MAAFKFVLVVLSLVCFAHCESNPVVNATQKSQDEAAFRRSREVGSYIGLVSCAMKYDVSCFVDAAEDYLEVRRTDLLAEADAEALRSTGRSDPDSRPSQLANTLGKLISELTNMFQNGFSGFFKSGREAADDDEELDENELSEAATSNSNGVARASKKMARGHHKKKEGLIIKIIRVVKYAIYALVLFLKIVAVLLMFNSFVNFKLLLVTMWGVAFLALKVWLMHKSGGEPVVIHEDVHHDHHYEDEHHYDHIPVEDWHRNYLPKDDYGQKLAYKGQKKSGWTSWLD